MNGLWAGLSFFYPKKSDIAKKDEVIFGRSNNIYNFFLVLEKIYRYVFPFAE